jgi:hypothetical protein
MSIDGGPNENGDAVATLSGELIAKAQAVASRSDELIHVLDDAQQQLADSGERAPAQRRIGSATPCGSRKASRKDGISDGLTLLTTQMSVAGADRSEIAARLRDEFGVSDPEPILKDMGL